MNEDLLIEQSNQQEISKFKNSIKGYAKKWPWILLCVFISFSISFFYLKSQSYIYKVESKVLIKKKQQLSDPSELLFGGGASSNKYGRINDEAIIFKSFPLIKSTLDSLKFDVTYRKEEDFKQVEVYKRSPVVFEFDRKQTEKLPLRTKFELKLEENQFSLSTSEPFEGESLDGTFKYGEQLKLASFTFSVRKSKKRGALKLSGDYVISVRSNESLSYAYKNRLSFSEVEGGSSILTMSIKSAVPEKSIDFINALIANYTEQSLSDKNKVAENTVKFIDKQLAIISDSLYNKEANLENFKSSEGIVGISSEGSALLGKYNEIESEKARYEIKQQYYDYLKENIKNGEGSNIQNLVAPTAFGIQDLIVNDLVKSLIELNLSKKSLEKEGNEKSPFAQQIDDRIKEISKALNESVDNLSNANTIILNKLNSRAQELMEDVRKLPNSERQLVNLNRLLKLNENIYLFLMEKRSSAAITMSSNTPDCKVIEPAMLSPVSPISPNKRLTYLISIIAGIFIPLVIMILKDFINDKITDKETVESSTQVPILGLIPKAKKDGTRFVAVEKPKSMMAESFRLVRSNLSFFQKKKWPYVIMLTSTVSSEGKTFCAINLASILAASGKKTVLLGFDLRKPQIHKYLNLENSKGISNYLTENISLDEVIRPTDQENLFLINSGSLPPNPAELLIQENTKEFIKKLKENFDYIIMDTPPVGIVADALILKQESDLNIYVVRQGFSKREYISRINDLNSSGKMTDMSILINDAEAAAVYGSGYYEEDEK